MVSVYISENTIKITASEINGGKTEIASNCFTFDAERCINGGLLANKKEFTDMLDTAWSEGNFGKSDVTLVINSTRIINKIVDVPVLNVKKTFDLLKMEFSDFDQDKEKIFCYSLLSENKETGIRKILASAVEKDYIEEFLSVFTEKEINVTSVKPAVSSVVKLFSKAPLLMGRNSIVQIYDRKNVVNILLVDGEYYYSGMNNIYGMYGTQAFGDEAAQGVSNIIQFARANGVPDEITDIYICGVDGDTFEMLDKSILMINDRINCKQLANEIKINNIECSVETIDNYVYSVAAASEDDKFEDLLFLLTNKQIKNDKILSKNVDVLAPLIITMAIMVFGIVMVFGIKISYGINLAVINHFLSNEENVERAAQYDANEQEIELIEPFYIGLEKAITNMDSYPVLNFAVKDTVKKCATNLLSVEISGFNAESGVLSLDTKVTETSAIHRFIELLKKEDIFGEINYTGYSYQEHEDVWTVKVECYLKEKAGRQKVQNEDN